MSSATFLNLTTFISMGPPSSSSTLFVFFLSLLLILISLNQVRSEEQLQQQQLCKGRLIHIRKLPPRFNLDLLLNCSHYPIYQDFCHHLVNHGLGHKTHNRSLSWYRTDASMLELIFHRRLFDYPCLTPDPLLADAIFLPYYASIDSLRYLYGPDVNSSAEHGLDLFEFLQQDSPHIWNRRSGHDHFLVMARPAWDFSQPLTNDPPIWGTSFLELPQFYNVNAMVLESRPWPSQEQAIPYPTSFHPPSLRLTESWIDRVRRSRRTTLMLFAGGGGGLGSTPNIRRSIRIECANATTATAVNNSSSGNVSGYVNRCVFVDCSDGVCEHDPIRYMKPMLEAVFCLQPPGDTPTRRSTFDSFLAGCIPVFFEDLSAKSQYGWHLPEKEYEEFSVLIPKEEVVFKGLKIVDVLSAIPKAEVRRMREKVIELMPRVVYRRHGSSMRWGGMKDAFDIAVEGTLQRIKSRIRGTDQS